MDRQTDPFIEVPWPGLISVNFLTEPVGLALHILTEPDGKTMSPVKTVLPTVQIISAYICIIGY